MCPVYIMIAAPLLLKETVSKIQIAVIAASFTGLFLIVGSNFLQGSGVAGMLLSGLSGVIYASIVLINRGIKHRIPNQTATFVQIVTATLVLLPFVLLDGGRLARFPVGYDGRSDDCSGGSAPYRCGLYAVFFRYTSI